MADATYAIPSFLGGQISAFAQGRFDKPDYHISMNVCVNSFPVEIGAWTRRPGTQFAGASRGGAAARVIKFDFEQAIPYTIEFTDGKVRFRQGPTIVSTNDTQTIVSISTATPAVVQTATAHGWSTADTVLPGNLGTTAPLLQNRQFVIAVIDATHFSIADPLTLTAPPTSAPTPIDGSTLGAISASATIARVQEITTPYAAKSWATLRAVQAETTDILLNAGFAPQALTVTTMPVSAPVSANAIFDLEAVTFEDGPYLDPFTNGVEANANQTTGVIQLTLSFPPFSATTSYTTGDFVTASSVNYKSLVDQNVGNTPASSPTKWQATSAAAAINDGKGFLTTDIGRQVRLFSEPELWLISTSYSVGTVVAYNPTGQPGASTYWQSLATGNIGNAPGIDLTNWQLIASNTAAQWTWGRIESLLNFIPGNISGVVQIGSLTQGGGLGAAFDGNLDKPSAICASEINIQFSVSQQFAEVTINAWVGQNFSATAETAFAVASVTVIPPTNTGFVNLTASLSTAVPSGYIGVNFSLYGSNSLPSSPTDGTLLGLTNTLPQLLSNFNTGVTYAAGYTPINIQSNDQVTTWKYVWVSAQAYYANLAGNSTFYLSTFVGQVEFVSPASSGTSSAGVNVELLGPPLLNTTPIRTWRMGAFSSATGYPTVGTYDQGRLWLAGAIPNRFDASFSNGIDGNVVNMAPTDQYGVVSAASAISETINSDSVNPILWMESDLQGILMGTLSGEFLVAAPTAGPISAINITVHRITTLGGSNVEPRRTDHTLVMVQRYGRKLNEYFPDIFSGKFSAPNLADKAQNVTRAGIEEIAFVQATNPIIWGRDALGGLFGVTYKRDSLASSQGPNCAAWHQHALGSGRTVQSLCAGPSTDGQLDALTMATLDPMTGTYHVEIMTDTMDEDTALASSWFLDDAVNPTSTTTTSAAVGNNPYGGLTINGLWHLNGKTAQVFAGGIDCGDRGPGTVGFTDFTVANGSIFVPYADGLSAGPGRGLFTAAFAAALPLTQIVVGFTYASQGQLVRPIAPAETGARNGPALAKMRRNHRSGALLANTLGISFGTSFSGTMVPARFTLADRTTNIPPLTTFSGISESQVFDQYSYDGMICWQVTRPWPATVVAIAGNLQTQDQ